MDACNNKFMFTNNLFAQQSIANQNLIECGGTWLIVGPDHKTFLFELRFEVSILRSNKNNGVARYV